MTQTGKNYGDALYDLARDEGLSDRIGTELAGASRLIAENEPYLRLLSAPNIPMAERLSVLDEAFGGRVHTYVLSFLKLLCERGHVRALRDCEKRFRSRYNADHGILEAAAVTAVPLSDALRARLSERLSALTGKRVDLQTRVDPTVLGGIRLEYDGVQLDGTLRQRLDGLRRTLADTVI